MREPREGWGFWAIVYLVASLGVIFGLARVAHAGHPRTSQVSTTLQTRPPAGTYLDMPLSTPGAYASGTGLDTKGGVTTCARNSTAYFTNAAGLLELAAINTCRVESAGLLVEEARTNVVYPSAAFAGWGTYGTAPTVVDADANCPLAPSGSVRMSSVTFVGVSSGIRQNYNAGGTYPFVLSIWMAAYGADAPSLAKIDNFGAASDLVSLTPVPVRVSTLNSPTYNRLDFTIRSDGSGVTATRLCVWGAQTEAGAFATSYIPTEGTAVARVADAVTVGITSSWVISAPWYVTVTVPTRLVSYGSGLPAWGFPFSLGPYFGANHMYLGDNGSGWVVLLRDSDTVFYREIYLMPADGTHRFTFCYLSPKVFTYSIDGTPVAKVGSDGAGLGAMSAAPSNLYLGTNSSGTHYFNGNLKNVKIGRGCKP